MPDDDGGRENGHRREGAGVRVGAWARGAALIVAVCLAACGQSPPAPSTPSTPPPAERPDPPPVPGDRVRVSSAAELQAALRELRSDRTIELAAGTYVVPGEAFFVPESIARVAIVGASGSPADVVIRGGRFGFWVNDVHGFQVRDLTIEGASDHGVILNCRAQAPVIHHVVLRDIGDQFVKANPGPDGCGVNDGVVEDSLFEYTDAAPDSYTNGVDVHFGRGWVIRRNTFRNFRVADGSLAGPAILMWNGSADTIVEANTFVDNAREVAFGLGPGKTAEAPVSNGALTDHRGGSIVRNTMTRRPGLRGTDVAILVADSPGTRVEQNTVTLAGTSANAIEYRFPRTTGVEIVGNDVDGRILGRDGATATLNGNTVR